MGILILVMAMLEPEIKMDCVMESDQLNGKMNQAMTASGFKVLVMVMEFTEQRQAKNIVVNGKMMFVTEKASGPKQMAQSFSETSEMICVMDYARCRIKGKEILY
jgi:hypothetical protein